MRDLFSIDGKVYGFLNATWQLMVLNLLFLVSALPIVTMGASISALYAIVFQIRNEKAISVFPRYCKAWKQNFKQGTIMWCVQLGTCAILIVAYWALSSLSNGSVAALFPFCVIVALLILGSCFCYPLIARYEMHIVQILHYSLLYGIRHIRESVLMVIMTLAFVTYVPIFQLRLLLLWVLFACSVTAYLHSWILLRVFARYTKDNRPLDGK